MEKLTATAKTAKFAEQKLWLAPRWCFEASCFYFYFIYLFVFHQEIQQKDIQHRAACQDYEER